MEIHAKFAKWLTKIIICFQMVSNSQSLVRLYENWYLKGYLGTFDIGSQSCINLPSLLRSRVGSMWTNECIMAYTGYNCEQYSSRFPSGYYTAYGVFNRRNTGTSVSSIGRCKSSWETAGHIQFYYGSELILEVKQLCKRVDIGPSISKATSINNNEKCVRLHLKNGKNVTLFEGKSYYSDNLQKLLELHRLNSYGSIIGISPCSTPKECNVVSLSATVVNFSVTDPKKKAVYKTSDLSMAATTTFINDGWATVSQEYKATKTITETTEVTLVKSFSKMNSWKLGTSFKFSYSAGIKNIGFQKNFEASISFAYTREETQTEEQSNTKRHEVSTEFSASQKIEIEPCTKYKVDSYLRVRERYPLQYTVTFEVTGKKGENRMTANQIRGELGRLNYMRDKDAYTVVASEVSEIFFDFGVETIVDGEGEIIVECRDKQLKTKPVVSFVNMSLNTFNTSLNESV